MQIAILLFENLDAQDAVGPNEVLQWLPGAEVADRTLEEVPRPDVVVVPGGGGEVRPRRDPAILAWLRQVHETSTWTTSVCSGALVPGAAGILRGKRAATHRTLMDEFAQFGATPIRERYMFDGKIATSAGVSTGIDMSLALAAKIGGADIAQAIQLGIEYDPQPRFEGGSPAKCPAGLVELVRATTRAVESEIG